MLKNFKEISEATQHEGMHNYQENLTLFDGRPLAEQIFRSMARSVCFYDFGSS